jgi:signal recognition particle subunit SRP54
MEKMMNGTYDYNDLLKQMKMIKRMGKLSGLLKMIPGMGQLAQAQNIDDNALDFITVIINSMTKEERRDPSLISYSSSRKRRIAAGSGRSVSDVNKLEQMLEKQKKAFKQLASMDESRLQQQAEKFQNGELKGFDPTYNQRNKR